MTLYGLGTTIGAGIYALVGKVAAHAGMWAPVSFLIASLLAAFTAFSFAELSARFPHSAGEAVYVERGFRMPRLATLVGLLVVAAGSVSAAAVTNGFVGYLGELVDAPRSFAIVGMVLILGGIAAWGISESVLTVALVTLVECGGLILVIGAASSSLAELPARLGEFAPPAPGAAWLGVFSAALLAFYAFLGFEDMVNVAEEVREVRRTLPRAIIATLVLTTLLYFVLALACVLVVPPEELGVSEAPLALVYARGSGGSPTSINLIGILALLNGALIQLIMASRVLYGLARQRALPPLLGRVHAGRRTPLLATGLVVGVVTALALWFPLEPLARATATLTLAVFALVNLSLWRVKRRDPAPRGVPRVPGWVPVVGFSVSVGFLGFEAAQRLGF